MQIDAFPFGSSARLLKPFWLQITPNSLSQQKQGEDWTAKQNGRVAAGPRGEPNRDDVKRHRGVWTGKENALNWLFLSHMETVKVGGGEGPGC